jgi:hypothetical protein
MGYQINTFASLAAAMAREEALHVVFSVLLDAEAKIKNASEGAVAILNAIHHDYRDEMTAIMEAYNV